ncbi:hypothetical protein Tco_1248880 [Tanacetum coccineum]
MDSMHSTLNMYYDYDAHVKGGAFSDYILKVLRIILVILPKQTSDTSSNHSEDGNSILSQHQHQAHGRFYTSAGNPIKEILLKLNIPDHKSILMDSKVTSTKHGRMTKPYSSPHFIANYFNAGYLKMKVKVPDSNCLKDS